MTVDELVDRLIVAATQRICVATTPDEIRLDAADVLDRHHGDLIFDDLRLVAHVDPAGLIPTPEGLTKQPGCWTITIYDRDDHIVLERSGVL